MSQFESEVIRQTIRGCINTHTMKINEIFDKTIKLHWQQRGRFELTSFDANGERYIIQIESKPVNSQALTNKKTAEVSFFTDNTDVEQAHSTTGRTNHTASSIYGIIFNALADKFQQYDAFYFTALSRHSINSEFSKKKNSYLTIANSLAKRTPHARVYDDKHNNGHAFLVSKITIQHDDTFVNETLKFISDLEHSTVPSLNR